MSKKATLAFVPFLWCHCLFAQGPPALDASTLPVREVTVFKDGHAYVIRDTALPEGASQVVIDELPAPVLGTFWPFASGPAQLVSAKAGREVVPQDVVAIDVRQIVSANTGKQVVVLTHAGERVEGKLLGVPSRQPRPAGTEGELLLLETQQGTRVLPLAQVRDLEVRGEFTGRIHSEQSRERLTLNVAGGGPAARVGVMYVQRGLRWIPAYRLDLDGNGRAAVQFEATLVNDLIDLEHATVNFVVGVPKFEFESLVDPISLQDEMAQVAAGGQYAVGGARNQLEFRNVLSNALRTQSAAIEQPAGQDPVPTASDGSSAEDLFVFTMHDVTLKKGERLVLPIASFELGYRDVYRLDVEFGPPAEFRQQLHSERMLELARLLAAPKARHVLRLRNDSDAPLTTAPVLVLASGRPLAQSRITYTSKGREVDLEINAAIDVRVETEEHEVQRDAGPFRLGSDNYGRVDVAGSITLWNGKPAPIELEVKRRVLGLADAAENGSHKQLDLVQAWQGPLPAWWGWWSWPYWWFAQNGIAEFRWQVKLEPGATTKLDASWHYFWR
jgi:hypothetical protein